MKHKVTIVPNTKSSKLITPYEGNPEFGYMVVNEKSTTVNNGWARTSKRSALIKGSLEELRDMIEDTDGTYKLPGRIQVLEYLEEEIPEDIMEKFFDMDGDIDEQVDKAAKRTDNDGIELTKNGQRIIRFSVYDGQGDSVDQLIQHDNDVEVKAYTAKRKAEKAVLEGGE